MPEEKIPPTDVGPTVIETYHYDALMRLRKITAVDGKSRSFEIYPVEEDGQIFLRCGKVPK